MERLLLLIAAMIFIFLPSLITVVRRFILARGGKEAVSTPSSAETARTGGTGGSQRPRRAPAAFPEKTAREPFSEPAPSPERSRAHREGAAVSGTGKDRPPQSRRRTGIVERLERLPPLQRAVVWSEILAPPKALNDDTAEQR